MNCPVCGGPLNRDQRAQLSARYCWPCFNAARPLQVRAMGEVARAVRRGELTKASTMPCTDCGAAAFGYDHRDYFEPLVVQPVCRSCNHARGSAYPFTRGSIEHIDLRALEAPQQAAA